MNPQPLTIEIRGIDEAEHTLQAVRTALANRGRLHAEMAVTAQQFTQDHLRGLDRHATAQRLGGTPTGHYEKSAARITAVSDDAAAIVRIPRNTGLGRAFGEITIRPRAGRKFLTIPAHQETYGRGPRDFGDDEFEFRVIESWMTFLALVWKETSGRHVKGEVAFWLRRSVTQKQDRTLLPPDDEYRGLARDVIIAHIANLVYRQ